MSISAAIRAAPTKKLTASDPQAGVRLQGAGRDDRRLGAAQVDGERDRGDGGAEEVPEAAVGEHLDARVGRRERQDHAREGRGEQQGAGEVRLAGDRGPAAEVDQRPAGGQRAHQEQHAGDDGDRADRGQPAAVAGEGDEGRAPGEVAQQRRWSDEDQRPGDQGDEQQQGARPVEAARRWAAVAGQAADGDRQDQADDQVHHEDEPPVGHRQHDRAEERTEHAADLLDRGDHAERHPASFDGVEVGDEREGRGHQPAAADALEEPAGHHRGHVVGEGGQQGARGEDDEGGDQDGHPAAQVGDAADQREHRDVPEQEARHDRRGLLELVDGHADRGHHLREREHHDVGVGGRERDRDRRQRQERPRPGGGAHGAVMSWVVP